MEDTIMLPTIVKSNWVPTIFDDFLGNNFWNERLNYGMTSTKPAVNIIESEKEYRIELVAPGLSKDDMKIDLHKNILTISSEKEDVQEENKDNFMRREFYYTSFSRSFTLPETVNSEEISAEHSNGILEVHIPKKPESVEKGPKQISIS
jgi:HSP20 family protein